MEEEDLDLGLEDELERALEMEEGGCPIFASPWVADGTLCSPKDPCSLAVSVQASQAITYPMPILLSMP